MLDWLPENVSAFGEGIDHLFSLIYYISVAIFVLVNAIYLLFIIKYRRKRKGEKAYHFHGSNVLEFSWTALPFALFLFLAFYSDGIWEDIKYASKKPNPDLTVEVMGQTYMWHFRYPGSDGVFGRREAALMSTTNPFGIDPADPAGKDDFTSINSMHIPVNKTVVVKLSSMDVIHSFFLPNMRVKQDAVPGQWVDVWFDSRKTGEYEIACAELCGSGHYLMRAVLNVQSQKEFDTWMDEQYAGVLASAAAPAATDAASPASATPATAAPAPASTEVTKTP
ncbi:MAG TPA: cytochrome c oxidase subunit II [Bacteroidota bacterium]|nr:cytochrome c oxidase subunit II [Bacteroidota bacterium]